MIFSSSHLLSIYFLPLDLPAHWLNVELQAREMGDTMAAINCAIEVSTIASLVIPPRTHTYTFRSLIRTLVMTTLLYLCHLYPQSNQAFTPTNSR